MPTVYKVLGQANPSAASDSTLYTVPAATSTIVSTITVCNQAAVAGTYRVAIRVNGAGISASQYIAYDVSLPANTSDTLTLGLTLGAADVITVRASSANFSFAAFGSELS